MGGPVYIRAFKANREVGSGEITSTEYLVGKAYLLITSINIYIYLILANDFPDFTRCSKNFQAFGVRRLVSDVWVPLNQLLNG